MPPNLMCGNGGLLGAVLVWKNIQDFNFIFGKWYHIFTVEITYSSQSSWLMVTCKRFDLEHTTLRSFQFLLQNLGLFTCVLSHSLGIALSVGQFNVFLCLLHFPEIDSQSRGFTRLMVSPFGKTIQVVVFLHQEAQGIWFCSFLRIAAVAVQCLDSWIY